MRLKITADDSYSTTMICNDTITSNELIEEFIKVRKLESPLSQHHSIESKNCMLAYYVTKATLQLYNIFIPMSDAIVTNKKMESISV